MITIKEVDRKIAERLRELVYYEGNLMIKLDKDKTLAELKQVKRYLQTNPSEEVVKKQYKQVCEKLKILTSDEHINTFVEHKRIEYPNKLPTELVRLHNKVYKISRLRDQKRVLKLIIDNW
mgnify:FL=1